MPVVRTDGPVSGRSVHGHAHVITKCSRMGSLPHFFTHGTPLLVQFGTLNDTITQKVLSALVILLLMVNMVNCYIPGLSLN